MVRKTLPPPAPTPPPAPRDELADIAATLGVTRQVASSWLTQATIATLHKLAAEANAKQEAAA